MHTPFPEKESTGKGDVADESGSVDFLPNPSISHLELSHNIYVICMYMY